MSSYNAGLQRITKQIPFFLMLAVFSMSASGQAADLAITNATIYTMNGQREVFVGTLVIEAGKISALGENIEVPAGMRKVDAAGGSVTPGLFNADTHIGIEEVSAIPQTVDIATMAPRVTASLRIADAFNYRSVVIPHNRSQGLTHALVLPESGTSLIAGQAALVNLSGDKASVLNNYIGMVVNLGEVGQALAGGSRAAALAQLREALEDARDYAANASDFNRGQRRSYALSRLDLEALGKVVDGSKPLMVGVHRAADILRVLELKQEQGIEVILLGAEEAWLIAENIAQAQTPVIIDPIFNLPERFEMLAARLDNAAILHRAGVPLMFTGMSWQNTHNAYLVRQSAGNAVAAGLPKDAALAALTSTPAAVFNMTKAPGMLTQGAIANLVVWSGDPLEVTSEPRLVVLEGEEQTLATRAHALAQRYLEKINLAKQDKNNLP